MFTCRFNPDLNFDINMIIVICLGITTVVGGEQRGKVSNLLPW